MLCERNAEEWCAAVTDRDTRSHMLVAGEIALVAFIGTFEPPVLILSELLMRNPCFTQEWPSNSQCFMVQHYFYLIS